MNDTGKPVMAQAADALNQATTSGELKFLVLVTEASAVDWLCEQDSPEDAQHELDEHMKAHPECESGWIVPTIGRSYVNT